MKYKYMQILLNKMTIKSKEIFTMNFMKWRNLWSKIRLDNIYEDKKVVAISKKSLKLNVYIANLDLIERRN